MKAKLKTLGIFTLCLMPLIGGVGCAALSGGKTPSTFEDTLFVTKTNYVDEVIEIEREVTRTNIIEKIVTKTNELNIVVKVTNTVPDVVVTTETVLQTNKNVPKYTFSDVKPEVKEDIALIGTAINAFFPGVGGLVTGGIFTGLTLWRRLKSYKKKADDSDRTSGVLAQNIEAIRKFIVDVLPDDKGKQLDEAIVQFMMREQDKVGAIGQVTDILSRYVKSHKTKQDLLELRNTLNNLTATPTS